MSDHRASGPEPTDQRADPPLEVRLTLPGRRDFARIARLAITGAAARNGLSYDDVEDLRIAVGEVFAVLIHPTDADARIELRCRLTDDAIAIDASRIPASPLDTVDELSTTILQAVVDEVAIDPTVGRISLAKRSSARP